MELTKEQQYWSLNGSFEALHKVRNYIETGKVKDISDLQKFLIVSMKTVNEEMSALEVLFDSFTGS